MDNQFIQDYLKTIYELAEVDSPVSPSRLAEAQRVNPASVTNMMKRLATLELVHYQKGRGVSLTKQGEKIALDILRRHRLIELFLTQQLGFGWEEVHDQAELLEHFISEELEERIAHVLEHPVFDPHGDPIPSKQGKIVKRYTKPLSTLSQGCVAVVSRVTKNKDADLLTYLGELGFIPGAEISVLNMAPFDGPLILQVDDSQQIISHQIAESIQVQTFDNNGVLK